MPTDKVVEDVKAEVKAKAVTFPPFLTPARPPNVQIILIGAGGTGARVLAPLVKMLRNGDRIDVIDHDLVEGRNLLRQHFTERHLQQNKAEVAVGRIKGEARRTGLTLQAWPSKANLESLRGVMQEGRGFGGRIILGCVDNKEARKDMMAAYQSMPGSAWLDAGNETSGGQIVLSLNSWPIWEINQMGRKGGDQIWKADRSVLRAVWAPEAFASCHTMQTLLPSLVRPEVKTPEQVAAEACAIRMDTQTVAANQMAAALMVNTLGWLLDEIPFSNPAAFFSTMNTLKHVPFAPTVSGVGGGQWGLNVVPV